MDSHKPGSFNVLSRYMQVIVYSTTEAQVCFSPLPVLFCFLTLSFAFKMLKTFILNSHMCLCMVYMCVLIYDFLCIVYVYVLMYITQVEHRLAAMPVRAQEFRSRMEQRAVPVG
jgi:hypothetical protein